MRRQERRKNFRIVLDSRDNVQMSFRYNDLEFKGDLWDYSRFGLATILEENDTLPGKNSKIQDITIHAFGESRNVGSGVISRKNQSGNLIMFGIHLLDEFIDLDFLINNQRLYLHEDERNETLVLMKDKENIKPEFKAFVSDFIYGLSIFQRKLDNFDQKSRDETPAMKKKLFQIVTKGIGNDLLEYMKEYVAKLKHFAEDMNPDERQWHGFYIRRSMWPFIEQSPFLERTNVKPRGYAGDSILMEMLYRYEYIGSSSFAKFLNYHPMSIAAADAVRNRRKLICDSLNAHIEENGKENYNALSIACGPAWEMQDFYSTSPNTKRVDLYLLDQDDEALQEAKSGIESVNKDKDLRIHYVQDSVRTLLRRSKHKILQDESYDFIYSMGLFDYLTQPVSRALVKKIHQLAAPGARIMIGNYFIDHPDQYYMEFLMDWPLLLKSVDDMYDLAADLPGENDISVKFEESGAQMFLDIRKLS